VRRSLLAKPRRDAIVSLSGRFGNQLFQLSYGLHLKQEFRQDVVFVKRNSLLWRPSAVERSIDQPISSLIYDSEWLSDGFIREVLLRTMERFPKLVLEDSHAVGLQNVPQNYSWPRVTRGYFQNYTYADNVQIELHRRLRTSNLFTNAFEARENRIAVHVRLGDYVSDKKNQIIYGEITPAYYRQAIEYLVENYKVRSVLIVSDDPARAFQRLSSEIQRIRGLSIELSSGGLIEDFCAIASSRAIVLANSTFGWWAAWSAHTLRSCPVIYPYPWFRQADMNGEGLSYPSWLALSRMT